MKPGRSSSSSNWRTGCAFAVIFAVLVLQLASAADDEDQPQQANTDDEDATTTDAGDSAAHIDRLIATHRATTPEQRAQQAAAALAVIERTIGPQRAAFYQVRIDERMPWNRFRLKCYEVDGAEVRVQIIASSGVAACRGFHHYLKHYLHLHVSWEGVQLDGYPDRLPYVYHLSTSGSSIIYYQNVCTWSYSFPWLLWPDWRRHIDWMALQGITLTLAPVQEHVWSEVYAELGLQPAEIDRHFAGPAFMAWQRMGNMRGWGGPLSEAFKRASSELQRQVVGAQRELGMQVALPAFAGHVPVAMERVFPNATYEKAERWCRFADAQCCPLFVEPRDPLFERIGALYLRRMVTAYGTDSVYFADPFNEMQPTERTPAYVASVAAAIYGTMRAVDARAQWLLQGWMFTQTEVWSDELALAFLGAVPRGRLLVLDLQSEVKPQWQRLRSYAGHPWLWCMLHNFGGTLGMHGSVEVLNAQITAAKRAENSTMVGFGLTMEGINQNYAVYDFALERGWDLGPPVDAAGWFDAYAVRRYGRKEADLQRAWQVLRTSVYAYNGTEALHGKYLICRRPGMRYKVASWYNYAAIEDALRALLAGSTAATSSDLLRYDLVDVTRQYLQTRADLIYGPLVAALRARDAAAFRPLAQAFRLVLADLETILGADRRFRLDTWLRAARRWAFTEAERQLVDINARNQITLWGPQGEILDYAMKQWAGVVSGYCEPRWLLFFADAEAALEQGRSVNMTAFKRRVFERVERPFTVAGSANVEWSATAGDGDGGDGDYVDTDDDGDDEGAGDGVQAIDSVTESDSSAAADEVVSAGKVWTIANEVLSRWAGQTWS